GTTDAARPWSKLAVLTGATVQPTLQFFDRAHGWLSAQDDIGTRYYRTADGGRSWAVIALPEPATSVVGFSDGSHGWAASLGRTSHLYVTRDGGATWTRRPDLPLEYSAPVFRNQSEGWLNGMGTGFEVYATVDGGLSWQVHTIDASQTFPVAS